ncbi:MAG: methyltransferase domain-containing protein [Polyangiaceae bacterium]
MVDLSPGAGMTDTGAQQFARAWVEAWNRRDAEAVLAHYAEDAVFISPKAERVVGSARVEGKAALRAYWHAALTQIQSLRFTLDAAFWSPVAETLTVLYLAELGAQPPTRAVEVMQFRAGRVVRGEALYGAVVASGATRLEHEARIQATFDIVASGYDHPVLSWFDSTASIVAQASRLVDGEQALDLATGTGKVALALAAQAPGAEVLGLDLSSGMLNEARAKAAAAGLVNARFVQGSFDDMGFGPRFNVVTCSFGLFFVDDMVAALARFGRQAAPRGRIVISTFRAGSFSPFTDAFLRLYAEFGFEARAPAWLRLDSEPKLGDVFEQSGLPRPRCTTHDFGFALPSANAWWEIVHNAGYRGMLRAMTAEQEARFKQRHLQDVQALLNAGTTRLEVGVLVASTEKE